MKISDWLDEKEAEKLKEAGIQSSGMESRHEYNLLNYYGMAFVKGCNFLFFLFPYIAIRMVLRRRNA